jgi:hypothetical protein
LPVVPGSQLAGGSRLAVGEIGYYFNDPELRNLEAANLADLSREAVAELNHLTLGVPVAADAFTVKATRTSPPPCRSRRSMILSSRLRMKNDLQTSPSIQPSFLGTLCRG